jgi:hypothetical protein
LSVKTKSGPHGDLRSESREVREDFRALAAKFVDGWIRGGATENWLMVAALTGLLQDVARGPLFACPRCGRTTRRSDTHPEMCVECSAHVYLGWPDPRPDATRTDSVGTDVEPLDVPGGIKDQ